MSDLQFKKMLLFVNAAVPLALLVWDGLHSRLGANPLEFITRTTGMLTLLFLIFSLAITPIRKITGWNEIIKYRRMIGLFAFFYGTLHFLTYVSFDRLFNFKSMASDILKRPFIAIGMLSFFLLVPLAITSTDSMIRKLGGKRWSRLHRLAYFAAIGGVIHFYILVKSDTRLPLTFAVLLILLLGYRILKALLRRTGGRDKAPFGNHGLTRSL